MIDAHTHFYDPLRPQGVPWPPADWPLYRQVFPEHWWEQARAHGAEATVAVEASEWREDNHWLLDLADASDRIAAVIGNLDPLSGCFASDLKQIAVHPLFRGVRWRHELVELQARSADCRSACEALQASGLILEVNGPSWMLRELTALANDFPDLRIVIDHAGLPGDPCRLSTDWFEAIAEASHQQGMVLKLSGLMEQSDGSRAAYGQAPRDPDVYKPILEHCWNCFGQQRLLFASNWPACEIGGSYADWLAIVEPFFRARGEQACARYFRSNALEVYRISL